MSQVQVEVAERSEPQWAAFVAFDWADQKHFWKLAVAGSQQYEQGELDNTPEALSMWVAELNQRFGERPIAVCLEQSRGALTFFLSDYPNLVLYPVHPTTSASFREAFYPSGAKSDPADAGLLLEILLHHRHRLRRLDPDTEETRLLQMLVTERRRQVNERTRQKNRLTACLKGCFPQVLQWFDELDSPLACDFIQRWPSLQEAQRSHPGTLRKFLVEHNCRSEERIQERIAGIQGATAATRDRALLEAGAATARALVALLKTLQATIAELEDQIGKSADRHPERPLFAALPGAGPVLLPRLIAAFGTRRERYASASELQRYSGIAPVTERSGNSQWIHFRWACPKFLRQTFHEFAAHSLGKSEWARAYYDLQRERHKSHHAAVRALAFKWIRVLFRCWKTSTPYDDQVYLLSLKKRRSPVYTALEWQEVAGFKKLCPKNT